MIGSLRRAGIREREQSPGWAGDGNPLWFLRAVADISNATGLDQQDVRAVCRLLVEKIEEDQTMLKDYLERINQPDLAVGVRLAIARMLNGDKANRE